MRFPRVPGPRSLAGQLFAMQAVLIAVVVAGCALFTYLSDRSQAEEAAGRQAMAVARSRRGRPLRARGDPYRGPSRRRLQPYALQVQHDTDVDFVTIMDPEGIRWTHPDKDQIGQRFLGHRERALRGESSRRSSPARSARPSARSPRSAPAGRQPDHRRWSARASGSRRSVPGSRARSRPCSGSRRPRWRWARSARTSSTRGCAGTPTG